MPFKYSQHPLKALYTFYFFVTFVFFRLIFWFIIALVPAWRQRRSWSFTRAFQTSITRSSVSFLFAVGPDILMAIEADPDPGVDSGSVAASKLGLVWVEGPPSEMVKGEVAEMAEANDVHPARVPAYWYGKRAGDGKHAQKAMDGEKVLYHLHGGGYVMGTGSPKGYNSLIPNSLLHTCSDSLHRALSLSYRLSSAPPFKAANPFPAALLDALAGYNYLINDVGFNPQNIIVSGDSAGGHLALALVRYLVENKIPTLPVPGALILLSPAADWSGSHDDSTLATTDEFRSFPSMRRNATTDYVVPFFETGYSARSILGALHPSALRTNPYLSPASLELELSLSSPTQPESLSGLFAGFPPTCIVAGGAEVMLDHIRTLRDRMRTSIGEGSNGMLYLEFEDALHDFLVLEWHEPERGVALGRMAQWLNGLQSKGDAESISKE